jgi:Tol biopolymer transport system component
LSSFRIKFTVWILSPLLLVMLAAASVGKLIPPDPQIYFIQAGRIRPGMVALDLSRNIFAPMGWKMPIRTVADWAWSPDGQRVVFKVTRNISVDLMGMKADGSELRWLTQDGRNNHAPVWSPDGTRIAFVSERGNNADIYVVDADGSNNRRLTENSDIDDSPAWSPDGTQIAFHSRRNGDYDIYVVDADGGNLRQITHSPQWDADPSWSPDGKRIAFISGRDGNYEVYRMNADGTQPERLTQTREFEFRPKWSPDGKRILFEAMTTGSDVMTYVIYSDGESLRRLTSIDMFLHDPLWHVP